MKTNYRRKNPKHDTRKVDHAMMQFTARGPEGFAATAYSIGNDFCGSKGERQAVKGAKQFLRHELRRHNKRIAVQSLEEFEDDFEQDFN